MDSYKLLEFPLSFFEKIGLQLTYEANWRGNLKKCLVFFSCFCIFTEIIFGTYYAFDSEDLTLAKICGVVNKTLVYTETFIVIISLYVMRDDLKFLVDNLIDLSAGRGMKAL